MKPDCIVIGAMKAGTTSLHHYLDAHPDIEMTTPKEVHYFSRNYEKGDEWYCKHFEDMDAEIVGESSPSYTRYPEQPSVPERMHGLLPEVRLVYVLRDPIDRIVSHYQHSVLLESESDDINDALRFDGDKYIKPSKYYLQLSRYLQYYELADILILSSYNLRNKTTKTVQKTYNFLGVDSSFEAEIFEKNMYKTKNRKKKSIFDKFILDTLNGRIWLKPILPQRIMETYQQIFKDGSNTSKHELLSETRDMLKDELASDVSRLRELTGRQFSNWSI